MLKNKHILVDIYTTDIATTNNTSNLKNAMEPPKIADAKCNQKSMASPDESRPPRYKNSLRLATIAAAEKQPKATPQPTKAPTRMLHDIN